MQSLRSAKPVHNRFLVLIRFLLVTMVAGLASVGAMVLHAILR